MSGSVEGHKIVAVLERRIFARTGAKRAQRREIIAERAGLKPGTIENVARRRLRDPDGIVAGKLMSALVRELEEQMQRFAQELAVLRRVGVPSGATRMAGLVRSLEAVRNEADELIGCVRVPALPEA